MGVSIRRKSSTLRATGRDGRPDHPWNHSRCASAGVTKDGRDAHPYQFTHAKTQADAYALSGIYGSTIRQGKCGNQNGTSSSISSGPAAAAAAAGAGAVSLLGGLVDS